MSNDHLTPEQSITFQSTRFGEITVAKDSIIDFPNGLIGFTTERQFVVLDHKPPFSWMHSINNPQLAFVIVDGTIFGDQYQVKAPFGDGIIDLKKEDEWAMIVVITVRSDPSMTTANLKAPIFVNLRNRKATQIILDDPRFSTRFPLWAESGDAEKDKKDEETSGNVSTVAKPGSEKKK